MRPAARPETCLRDGPKARNRVKDFSGIWRMEGNEIEFSDAFFELILEIDVTRGESIGG